MSTVSRSKGSPRLLAWLTLLLFLCVPGCTKPDGTVTLRDGTAQGFRFNQWHGQWLVVNYWAQWCAPCRHEIPELNALNERDDVQVLGVNFDGISGAKLNEVVAEMDVSFPTLAEDPGARYGLERPSVLPVTLVVNPDGQLQEVLQGPQTQQSIDAVMQAGVE